MRINHSRVCLASLAVLLGVSAAAAGDVPPIHRPRDRHYDVLHYRLTIEADLRKKTVAGEAEITLVPVRTALRRDAARRRRRDEHLPRQGRRDRPGICPPGGHPRYPARWPYAVTDTLTVTVDYSVTAPVKGLYFSGPDETDPAKRWQVYSQGESMENHHWFPCYDFPNDKATSEMIVTVESAFTAISNGKLVGTQKDASGAKTTFHWREELPHVSYLVSLVVGEYSLVEDSWRGKPIMNYRV